MASALLVLLLAVAPHYVPHVQRSSEVRRAFMRETGFAHGRKGWVVDHIMPLCAGGEDATSNMQWQTAADAKAKDRLEKALCRCLRKDAQRGQP